MDKISLLHERRDALEAAERGVRAEIVSLVDADSFVELSAFAYSKEAFFGTDAQGEGVVTGFATVGGYPFYIVAQNFAVSHGGLSKANCEKIAKTLAAAEKSGTPVVYLLHSLGVRVGEGVRVLEGVSELLLQATRLKGTVLQFAVLLGEVYGSSAALASVCDCVFFTPDAVLCANSPLVLSAKAGKNLKPTEVGGYAALGGALLPAIPVSGMKEVASKLLAVTDLVRIPVVDAELNEPAPALNGDASAKEVLKLLENGVELGAAGDPAVRTVLCRIGGIAVAAVVFDGAEINAFRLEKIKYFAGFAACYGLPLVTFVDCLGAEPSLAAANSGALREIAEYLSVLDSVDAKIAVVTGRAVGLGYALFAAKSAGFDYTYALATAQISLFGSAAGAQIELAGENADAEKLASFYADHNADPVNAAQGGYLDDIVEPQFLKQYLIASLQTLVK